MTLIVSFLLSGCCLFAAGKSEVDEYVGMTLEEVVNKFGSPDSESMKIIDKDYRGYEFEPDYSKYFSDSQRIQSVMVKFIIYEKRKEKIYLWLKNIDNDWIVFSSLRFNPKWVVF